MITQREGGISSRCPTCIAYFIEIRKFRSKTWFIKVLILRPKLLSNSPTSTFNFNFFFWWLYPRTPVKKERGGKGQRGKGRAPQFTFLVTPLVPTVWKASCSSLQRSVEWKRGCWFTSECQLGSRRVRVSGFSVVCCRQTVYELVNMLSSISSGFIIIYNPLGNLNSGRSPVSGAHSKRLFQLPPVATFNYHFACGCHEVMSKGLTSHSTLYTCTPYITMNLSVSPSGDCR